jgi:hypothetical protein
MKSWLSGGVDSGLQASRRSSRKGVRRSLRVDDVGSAPSVAGGRIGEFNAEPHRRIQRRIAQAGPLQAARKAADL